MKQSSAQPSKGVRLMKKLRQRFAAIIPLTLVFIVSTAIAALAEIPKLPPTWP